MPFYNTKKSESTPQQLFPRLYHTVLPLMTISPDLVFSTHYVTTLTQTCSSSQRQYCAEQSKEVKCCLTAACNLLTLIEMSEQEAERQPGI